MVFHITLIRNVNALKWNLLNYTELKTPDYGEYVPENTDTF